MHLIYSKQINPSKRQSQTNTTTQSLNTYAFLSRLTMGTLEYIYMPFQFPNSSTQFIPRIGLVYIV
jgi:hypothetical protein